MAHDNFMVLTTARVNRQTSVYPEQASAAHALWYTGTYQNPLAARHGFMHVW